MQKVLQHRVWRSLKKHMARYMALGLMIIFGMYVVVSLVAAADTVILGTEEYRQQAACEDGQFAVMTQLTQQQKDILTDEGITLEEMFYLDFLLTDESTLRVYKNRETVNLLTLTQGEMAQNAGELVLERRYAEERGYQVGDDITIAGKTFEVVGIGCVPDYEAPFKELSDSVVDSSGFGVAFLTQEGYEQLADRGKSIKAESLYYAYQLNGKLSNEELKELIKETGKEQSAGTLEALGIKLDNMTLFLIGEDNPRIGAAADEQIINKVCGIFAGVVVMVLFTYVISVFVIHGIEKESSTIGALYALGVKRRDLMRHYLQLPVIITAVAGIIGTALGFSNAGAATQLESTYQYFSIVDVPIRHPIYLVLYSVVMPPVVAWIVNYFVIRKALSRPVLALLKEEQKENKALKVNLGNMGFVRRFQIRQMIRELRSAVTVIFGMFISLLIMMLALNCAILCTHIKTETAEDVRYEYMYTYKYPQEVVPEGGEAAFAKNLRREIYGYNLEVTLLGIQEGNPYFQASCQKGENKVVISSAASQKYGLQVGDDIILKDEEQGRNYAFTVTDVTQYAPGLFVFMDIDSMRELFGVGEEYYNVVFAEKELEIPWENLYAVTERTQIVHSAGVFADMMKPMVTVLCGGAVFIFFIVMYLMLKVMVDRAAYSISLAKVFGFRTGEIRKLYLNGNFYMIAVGALITIPLSKCIMDKMYPMLISNIATGMNLSFSWQLYVALYGGVILLYLAINRLLLCKIKKILPAEVLKNKE